LTDVDSTVVEFDVDRNADINKINDIETINNELLLLNQSYSSTNEEIDKFNSQIENYNTRLANLKMNLDTLNKWDNKFTGKSDLYADNSNKFILKNTKSFNPFASYEKWELFCKAYNLKIEGWELLCSCYKYNEGLVKMKLEEQRLKTKKFIFAVERQKYLERYDKLKQRYRELESRK
jgi:chromosome segregation ATPase